MGTASDAARASVHALRSRRANGTGGAIRQRKDGRYQAEVSLGRRPDGTRQRVSVYGRTEREVKAERARLLRLHAATDPVVDSLSPVVPQPTVGECLTRWLEALRAKHGEADSRYQRARTHVELCLLPGLGHVPLGRLNSDAITAFLGVLTRDGQSPSQLRAIQTTLRAALAQAARWQCIAVNPSPPTAQPTLRRRRRGVIDYAAIQRAYWELVAEHSEHPDQAAVGTKLGVVARTVRRTCNADRRGWPPPRP